MTSRHDLPQIEAEAAARRLLAIGEAVEAGRFSVEQGRRSAANVSEGMSDDVKAMVADIVHRGVRR